MADSVTAKATESKFRPHPAGMFVAKCVDVLNYGMCVSDFPGKPKTLDPKIGLVFRTAEVNPETNEPMDIVVEYGLFMSTKAKLRTLLEGWRGKPFTQDELKAGVPLERLVGKMTFLNVGNKTSPASGRTYAIVLSANPVPKGTPAPQIKPYTRPKFLEDRKAEYLKKANEFRAEIGVDFDGNPVEDHEEERPQRVTRAESGGVGHLEDAFTATVRKTFDLPDPEGDDDENSLPF